MAEISAQLIKALREKTAASFSDCKKALEAANGDMNDAEKWLREHGALVAAKRADRETREGLIVTAFTDDHHAAAMVEVNCETDFVARNDDFKAFAAAVAALALKNRTHTIDDLKAAVFQDEYNNQSVQKAADELVGKIGEKVEIKRVVVLEDAHGLVYDYVHLGSKLASLVHLTANNGANLADTSAVLNQIGKDVAMQVAASAPLSVGRDGVPKDNIEREIEIYKQQALNEGKPAQVIERIAGGKLEKYYQDVVLLEQSFIKDNGKMVRDIIKEVADKLGTVIEVKAFQRFQLGEK